MTCLVWRMSQVSTILYMLSGTWIGAYKYGEGNQLVDADCSQEHEEETARLVLLQKDLFKVEISSSDLPW